VEFDSIRLWINSGYPWITFLDEVFKVWFSSTKIVSSIERVIHIASTILGCVGTKKLHGFFFSGKKRRFCKKGSLGGRKLLAQNSFVSHVSPYYFSGCIFLLRLTVSSIPTMEKTLLIIDFLLFTAFFFCATGKKSSGINSI